MALCLNLAIAPALYAATGSLSRGMPTPSSSRSGGHGLAAYLTTVILNRRNFDHAKKTHYQIREQIRLARMNRQIRQAELDRIAIATVADIPKKTKFC
ncbi:hypothetical protein [Synechococcus sp. 7002]|uniref:hypothetical protein n=1 Tax=Synechococcus sp. 7002 TaxID=1938862 RepID=UPI000A2AE886|nr:hypothetical protein [Synechococcus sp. 7002]SMQ86551.1 hypothetical protein SAMN06272774_3312 [Synechococcus sp. 7002]